MSTWTPGYEDACMACRYARPVADFDAADGTMQVSYECVAATCPEMTEKAES